VQALTVVVVDGKAIERAAKRLKLLQGRKGGVLGGKALGALELASGLAVAMATHPDGETNEAKLVPALLPQVRPRRSTPKFVLQIAIAVAFRPLLVPATLCCVLQPALAPFGFLPLG
jgi:hypothetical protein